MKKILITLLAIPLAVSMLSGIAFGWGSASGDGSNYAQLQETAVFFNNSGRSMFHGQAVILDTSGSGVTAGTTLGAYVTTVNASADSVLVVGVVKGGFNTMFANQGPVVVVTKGPEDAYANDSGDAITINTAVGTASTSNHGAIGGGTNLGIALEAGDGTDNSYCFIWVDPTGAD